MKLERQQVGKGPHTMWALNGKIINGLSFAYFCCKEKTKPSKINKEQIKRFLDTDLKPK